MTASDAPVVTGRRWVSCLIRKQVLGMMCVTIAAGKMMAHRTTMTIAASIMGQWRSTENEWVGNRITTLAISGERRSPLEEAQASGPVSSGWVDAYFDAGGNKYWDPAMPDTPPLASVLAFNNNGAEVGRFFHEPFGRRVGVDGEQVKGFQFTAQVSIGFTGQKEDDDLELIDMHDRVYDPVQKRFLTPDPIVSDPLDSQSYNRYAYVLNNPLREF